MELEDDTYDEELETSTLPSYYPPSQLSDEKVESSEEPLSAMSMVDELVNEALPSYFGGAGGEHNQLSDSNADLASYGYSHNGSFHEFHYHLTFAFKACRKKKLVK